MNHHIRLGAYATGGGCDIVEVAEVFVARFVLFVPVRAAARIRGISCVFAAPGGIVVCAPIAPYEVMRAEMRDLLEAVGRFVLVHISTPLEVCEARDRKGLYARARAGEIPQFIVISDPYEEPTDADLVTDAGIVSPSDAVDQIVAVLTRGSG